MWNLGLELPLHTLIEIAYVGYPCMCSMLCNLSFIKRLYINGHNTSEDENPGLAWIRGSCSRADLMVQYLVNPSVITIPDKTHQNLFCCSEIMPSTTMHTPPRTHYRISLYSLKKRTKVPTIWGRVGCRNFCHKQEFVGSKSQQNTQEISKQRKTELWRTSKESLVTSHNDALCLKLSIIHGAFLPFVS